MASNADVGDGAAGEAGTSANLMADQFVGAMGNLGLRACSKSAKGISIMPIVKARLKEKKSSNSLLIRRKKTFLNSQFSAPSSDRFTFDFFGDLLKDFKDSKAQWTSLVRWLGTTVLSGSSKCIVDSSTLSLPCRTMGSFMILPKCKHTIVRRPVTCALRRAK